jgi:hypothetical protein
MPVPHFGASRFCRRNAARTPSPPKGTHDFACEACLLDDYDCGWSQAGPRLALRQASGPTRLTGSLMRQPSTTPTRSRSTDCRGKQRSRSAFLRRSIRFAILQTVTSDTPRSGPLSAPAGLGQLQLTDPKGGNLIPSETNHSPSNIRS